MLAVVLGHAAGLFAWRKRRSGVAFWLWMTDPFYFIRPSYYGTRVTAIQALAGVLLLAGLIGVVLLVLGAARGAHPAP